MSRTFLSADALRGAGISVATASDSEYDTRRATFNGLIDRRPTLVAECSSSAHVAAVINHARESGLPGSVRGGGHSVAGHCIGDGAAVVDLRGMRHVRVDATNRLAIAGGGATWLEYDTATQKFGLASTGGTFTDTGIGGLTLGGGIGYLQGTLGFAVDSLAAVEMVTADGEIIRASERVNADLFWAIRGGGGNFGVVTSFEYRVHPVGELYGGVIAYPLADAAKMLRLARDLAAGAPDELVLQAVLSTSRETRDDVAAIIVCFQGSVSAGERAIAPLRDTLRPVLDALRPLSYNEMQATSAPFPFGLRHYWKGQFLSKFPTRWSTWPWRNSTVGRFRASARCCSSSLKVRRTECPHQPWRSTTEARISTSARSASGRTRPKTRLRSSGRAGSLPRSRPARLARRM